MSAVKDLFFTLTHQPIGSVQAPRPRAIPSPQTPRLTEVHLLTYFGETVGVYANNASAMTDMATMRYGVFLNGGDMRELDAYEVVTKHITYL